jgi:hypothetical protein
VFKPAAFSTATLALFLAVTIGAPLSVASDLTAPAYVELTKESMADHTELMRQLARRIRTFDGTAAEWSSVEGSLQSDFAGHQSALYARFSVVPEQYANFYAANKRRVDRYLRTNPAAQQQIDALSATLAQAIERYEQLKADMTDQARVPPQSPVR